MLWSPAFWYPFSIYQTNSVGMAGLKTHLTRLFTGTQRASDHRMKVALQDFVGGSSCEPPSNRTTPRDAVAWIRFLQKMRPLKKDVLKVDQLTQKCATREIIAASPPAIHARERFYRHEGVVLGPSFEIDTGYARKCRPSRAEDDRPPVGETATPGQSSKRLLPFARLCAFDVVHLSVRPGDDVVDLLAGLQLNESNTERCAGHGGRQRLADLLEPSPGILTTRVGQRADELVAAVAHGQVIAAQARAQCGAEFVKKSVAGRVALFVVELFELVDVKECDHQRCVGSAGLADALTELIAPRFALQHAREWVSVGAPEVFSRALPVEGCFLTVKRSGGAVPGCQHPVNGRAIV
jgi:hypothetical protein